MFKFATSPQSIGRVLDDGIALFKVSFRQTYPLALLGALLFVVVHQVVERQQFVFNVRALNVENFNVVIATTWIVALLIYHVLIAAIMLRMVKTTNQTDLVPAGSTLKLAIKFGLLMIIPGMIYILAIMVGSVLLVVPAVILSVSLLLYGPVLLFDGRNVIGCLVHSHLLVWGNWWRAATVFAVPIVIGWALSSLVGLASALLIGADRGFDLESFANSPTVPLIGQILNAACTAISTPLLLGVGIVLMRDLQIRRSGADIDYRIAEAPAQG